MIHPILREYFGIFIEYKSLSFISKDHEVKLTLKQKRLFMLKIIYDCSESK